MSDFDDYPYDGEYEDDLRAQNAVEDAKYDTPEQDEPPEDYYDQQPPAEHFKGCHPEHEHGDDTPAGYQPQPTESCWHCGTATTVGACGCAECFGPGSEYVPASATYHCPLCGRWWAYMNGLNVMTITLGAKPEDGDPR